MCSVLVAKSSNIIDSKLSKQYMHEGNELTNDKPVTLIIACKNMVKKLWLSAAVTTHDVSVHNIGSCGSTAH